VSDHDDSLKRRWEWSKTLPYCDFFWKRL